MPKNKPNKDPKFHQYEIFVGDGSLRRVSFKEWISWFIFMCIYIKVIRI